MKLALWIVIYVVCWTATFIGLSALRAWLRNRGRRSTTPTIDAAWEMIRRHAIDGEWLRITMAPDVWRHVLSELPGRVDVPEGATFTLWGASVTVSDLVPSGQMYLASDPDARWLWHDSEGRLLGHVAVARSDRMNWSIHPDDEDYVDHGNDEAGGATLEELFSTADESFARVEEVLGSSRAQPPAPPQLMVDGAPIMRNGDTLHVTTVYDFGAAEEHLRAQIERAQEQVIRHVQQQVRIRLDREDRHIMFGGNPEA